MAAQVTLRIEVASHHLRAGQTMPATVVIDNNTGAPLRLTGPNNCKPRFAIALGGGRFPPKVLFPADCLDGPLVIPRGETRFNRKVDARTSGCSSQPQGPPPRCLATGGPPPLPPGTYLIQWFDDGTGLPAPKAEPIRVVP